MRRKIGVSKSAAELADVLEALRGRRESWSLEDEVASLRLVVEKLATTIALHEVQLAKLRECVAMHKLRDGGE